MFWETLSNLCNERGVSPNGVCAELGLSNATATKWKNGAVPRQSTLRKIADYFGVSVDYLLGTPADPQKETEPTAAVDPELLSLIDDMTEEELEEMKRYAEFILSKKK